MSIAYPANKIPKAPEGRNVPSIEEALIFPSPEKSARQPRHSLVQVFVSSPPFCVLVVTLRR